MNIIVITKNDDQTFLHLESTDIIRLATGGPDNHDGWTIDTNPAPFPPEAIKAFRALAESRPEEFEIRDTN